MTYVVGLPPMIKTGQETIGESHGRHDVNEAMEIRRDHCGAL